MSATGPGIMHVRIDPAAQRKPQKFGFDPTGERLKASMSGAGGSTKAGAEAGLSVSRL